MVFRETCLIGILGSLNKCHSGIVDKVVKQLGQELSEPPHAHKITTRWVVSVLPGACLGLPKLFLVIVTIQFCHTPGDLFIDLLIESQILRLSKLINHEELVLPHDDRLLTYVSKRSRHHRAHSLEQQNNDVEKVSEVFSWNSVSVGSALLR